MIDEKAKWYRLGPLWRHKGTHPVTIRNKRHLERITKFRAARDRRSSWGPQHHYLNECLKLVRVDDAMSAPWTCQQRSSKKQHLSALQVALLNRAEGRITVDYYGRVHSPVTNLRRTLRPALRLYDQELVEIDVSNAQPMLLGFIVAKLIAGDWSHAQAKRPRFG